MQANFLKRSLNELKENFKISLFPKQSSMSFITIDLLHLKVYQIREKCKTQFGVFANEGFKRELKFIIRENFE